MRILREMFPIRWPVIVWVVFIVIMAILSAATGR